MMKSAIISIFKVNVFVNMEKSAQFANIVPNLKQFNFVFKLLFILINNPF